MDSLFSSFDNGISFDNVADFEEIMSKTLELGNISTEAIANALQNTLDTRQFTCLGEDQGNPSTEHALVPGKTDINSYFTPPSPVSRDASLFALNFESNDHTAKETTDHQVQVKRNGSQSQQERNNLFTQPDATSRTTKELSVNAFSRGHPNQNASEERDMQKPQDHGNVTELENVLASHERELHIPQGCPTAPNQMAANADNSGDISLTTGARQTSSLPQPIVLKRNLNYENQEHGLQELFRLLSEPVPPPNKKRRIGYHCRNAENPELNVQPTDRTLAAPCLANVCREDPPAKNVPWQQIPSILKPHITNDAWTEFLRSGLKEVTTCQAPAYEQPAQLVSVDPPAKTPDDAIPFIENCDKEPALKLSAPLDDSWFLDHNPPPAPNFQGAPSAQPRNDPPIVAQSETTNPVGSANFSYDTTQPCTVVPQVVPQVEILYPSALGNKPPEAVRSLLRASANDIVSKIELYWSHFHDYRISAERAGHLLREKSVRFERRKRMGPEVPAIEKKAIRAQRNRERSQALRRYHKQRMEHLEAVSGQLKVYNSVAKSLINCLLEEPKSLDLVQEYFKSHECNEELLAYLRESN